MGNILYDNSMRRPKYKKMSHEDEVKAFKGLQAGIRACGSGCGCDDSHGNPKNNYETKEVAQSHADFFMRKRGLVLYPYACPALFDGEFVRRSFGGWHLTKNVQREKP